METQYQTKLKNNLVTSLENSTIHGLSNLLKARNLITKSIWTLFLVLSLISCFYMISIKVLHYLDYPVISNIAEISEKSPEFPTVTVCVDRYQTLPNITCSFNHEICDAKNWFQKNTLCYGFNLGYIVNYSTIIPKRNPVSILKSTKPGPDCGLRLTVQTNLRYFYLYVNNHTKNIAANTAVYASKGMETNFIVKRTMSSKLAAPFSNCRQEVSFAVNSSSGIYSVKKFKYFQSVCFNFCFNSKIFNICNKTSEFEDLIEKYYTDIYLYYARLSQMYDKCVNEYFRVVHLFAEIGEHELCEKFCPIECNSIIYTIEPRFYFSNSPLDKDKAYVNIYYENFEYTLIEEIPKISSTDLFSYIGSFLGKIDCWIYIVRTFNIF